MFEINLCVEINMLSYHLKFHNNKDIIDNKKVKILSKKPIMMCFEFIMNFK